MVCAEPFTDEAGVGSDAGAGETVVLEALEEVADMGKEKGHGLSVTCVLLYMCVVIHVCVIVDNVDKGLCRQDNCL